MRRIAILLLPLALAACHREPAGTPPPASDDSAATAPATPGQGPDLEAWHWRLQSARDADGRRMDALFVEDDAPLTLDFRDGRIGLSGGCNGGGADYTVEGETLQVGRFVQTMMACADERLMRLDEAATRALAGDLRWRLDTNGDPPSLTLVTAGGETLAFAGEPTVETRFGGPGETVFLEVAAERVACSHPLIPDHQCLQVREIAYDDAGLRKGEPGEWEPLYEEIEGYVHEPGTRSVLRLKRFERSDAPADASSIVYVHDMTVESERAR